MSRLLSQFEMRGEFRGFIRTAKGKRRMLLRTEGGNVRLKLSKELRNEFGGILQKRNSLAVSGLRQEDDGDGSVKHVVLHLRLLSEPKRRSECAACPIRVCTKKNCWQRGGEELWSALETGLKKREVHGAVQLKGVRCLGRCKQAPNVATPGRYYSRCSVEEVDAIIARAVAGR